MPECIVPAKFVHGVSANTNEARRALTCGLNDNAIHISFCSQSRHFLQYDPLIDVAISEAAN